MEHGIDFLRAKLAARAVRVDLRYRYYEMKNHMRKIKALIPPEFANMTYSLGWCGRAVDSIADRMVFDRFEGDSFLLNEIYTQNNADILFDSAVLSALISSCCFLGIDKGEDGYPTIECIDGGSATGIIDPTTSLLTEGYAVLKLNDEGYPALEAYYLPGRTLYFEDGKDTPSEEFRHSGRGSDPCTNSLARKFEKDESLCGSGLSKVRQVTVLSLESREHRKLRIRQK